jgi:CHAT domain-containing protein/tetratricopeptide (TPR) repeat protein
MSLACRFSPRSVLPPRPGGRVRTVPRALLLAAVLLSGTAPAAAQGDRTRPSVRLVEAAKLADSAGVAQALAAGADPAHRTENGWTALHWAAMAPRVPPPYPADPRTLIEDDYLPVVRLLVGGGASVDAGNDFDDTPLHIAARRAMPKLARLLVELGADPNRRGARGYTPLRAALEPDRYHLDRLATAAALIRMGARPTPADWFRTAPELNQQIVHLGRWPWADDPQAPALTETYLSLLEAFAGRNHPQVLDGRRAVGTRLYGTRQYARAEAYLDRLMADLSAPGRPADPFGVGAARLLVGRSLRERGRPAEARRTLEQAVDELRAATREAPQGHAALYLVWALQDLSMLLLHEGEAVEAERLLREAEAAAVTAEGTEPWMRPIRHLQAHALLARGNAGAAERLLRKTLLDAGRARVEEAKLVPVLRDAAFASVFAGPGGCGDALPLLARAADAHARFLYAPPRGRESPLFGTSLAASQALLEREARLGADLLGVPCGAGQGDAEMYERIARSKGGLLDYVRVHNQAAMPAGFDDPEISLARVAVADQRGPMTMGTRFLAAIHYVRARLGAIALGVDPEVPPQRREAVYDSLGAVRELWEAELARSVGEADPVRAPLLDARHSVRALLQADEVLVDVYRYDAYRSPVLAEGRYAAFVVTRAAPPVRVELGSAAAVDSLLAAWRDATVSGDPAPAAFAPLLQAVWLPVAAALPAGVRRVWISPDAQLARLPWPALAQGMPGTEGLLISLVDAPRQLRRPESVFSRRAPGSSLLLVGDVDFGPGTRFRPLRGTRAEIDSLTRLAPRAGLPVTVRRSGGATVSQLRDDLQRALYVHIGTHGYFVGEDPAGPGMTRSRAPLLPRTLDGGERQDLLLSSGLALAGANGGWQGLVSAEELLGLDLRGVKLVVLSACDAGRGQELTGQGVMGLRASLLAAGADAVLMSLWKVPDESAVMLMQEFYTRLWTDGLSPAAALQAAQAKVRDDRRFGAPVHWAGWVLAGRGW